MQRDVYSTGRLATKFGKSLKPGNGATGVQPLPLSSNKESRLYLPESYEAGTPAALAIMLHGSGGTAAHGLSYLRSYADAYNIILLAPASQDYTWDILAGKSFGKDVLFLDSALQFVFAQYAIDPTRLAIGGFSDGASYALCVGLTN